MIALVRVKYLNGKESIFKVPYKTMFSTARMRATKLYPQRRIKGVYYVKKRGSEGQHPLLSNEFIKKFIQRHKKESKTPPPTMRTFYVYLEPHDSSKGKPFVEEVKINESLYKDINDIDYFLGGNHGIVWDRIASKEDITNQEAFKKYYVDDIQEGKPVRETGLPSDECEKCRGSTNPHHWEGSELVVKCKACGHLQPQDFS